MRGYAVITATFLNPKDLVGVDMSAANERADEIEADTNVSPTHVFAKLQQFWATRERIEKDLEISRDSRDRYPDSLEAVQLSSFGDRHCVFETFANNLVQAGRGDREGPRVVPA